MCTADSLGASPRLGLGVLSKSTHLAIPAPSRSTVDQTIRQPTAFTTRRRRSTPTTIAGSKIVVLDLRELTAEFDFFLVITGASRRQLHAIADEIKTALRDVSAKNSKAKKATPPAPGSCRTMAMSSSIYSKTRPTTITRWSNVWTGANGSIGKPPSVLASPKRSLTRARPEPRAVLEHSARNPPVVGNLQSVI